MNLTEITILLPCHSLEDFPTHFEGRRADGTLAAWTAAWHPALLACAGRLPTWHSVDTPPMPEAGRLIFVPASSRDRLGQEFNADEDSSLGLVSADTLDGTIVDALALCEIDAGGIEPAMIDELLALGFCRLQMEILSRNMRRPMELNEAAFENSAVAAAQAAVAANRTALDQHLAACYAMLDQQRRDFYPVDFYLLDLTLVAESTLGESLRCELSNQTPTTMLATTSLWQLLAEREPQDWSALLAAASAGRVCVTGGEPKELESPLLPLGEVLQSVAAGREQYEKLFGRAPTVFARRKAGLWPGLPQVLTACGYESALHVTLDDGRFPLTLQCKARWEGPGDQAIDIFARVPFDAAKPDSYIGLARHIADSMDSDHVATLALAHWPNAACRWHQLLRVIAARSDVLGKFVTLDDYFAETDAGNPVRFLADKYRTPYLQQAVNAGQADPISRFARAHRQQAARAAKSAIDTLATLTSGTEPSADEPRPSPLERLSAILPRGSQPTSTPRSLAVNPLSFARRAGGFDVPAMGFAWVDPAATARGKPIAQENTLSNEYFELAVGKQSGGIQSLKTFKQRGNRLSQQISLRMPPPESEDAWTYEDQEDQYATMRAESVEITVSTPLIGEIVSRGALFDVEGRRMASFRQATRVLAGSRVVHIEIDLEELDKLEWNPWRSYYAVRFAWPEEDAQLWRSVSLARERTDASRVETGEFIDIDNGHGVITLLPGGLPYHVRPAMRMLDTLLVVRGESERHFSLAVGVDLPNPAWAAAELLAPRFELADAGIAPKAASGWFFHLDAKNVIATDWQPLTESTGAAGESSSVTGFRARIFETSGRSARAKLRTFRKLARARQIDHRGQTLLDLPVEGDLVRLDLTPHEWISIEATWAR